MGGGGKGGSSTQTTQSQPQGLSKEERILIQKEIKLADFQLKELKKQSKFQDILFKSLPAQLEAQEEFQKEERVFRREEREFISSERKLQEERDKLALQNLLQAKKLLPLQAKIAEEELARLERGGKVDDITAKLIDELTAQQQEIGLSDIDQKTEELITQVTQETAPARGLRPTDTPIVESLDKIGREVAQEKGQFIRQLQSGAAEAKLNFPLAQGQLTAQRGQFLANLGGLAGRFQSELQNQAAINRFQSTGTTGSLGLGLGTVGGQPGQVGLGIQGNTFAQGRTSSTSSTGAFDAEGIADLGTATGTLLQRVSSLRKLF